MIVQARRNRADGAVIVHIVGNIADEDDARIVIPIVGRGVAVIVVAFIVLLAIVDGLVRVAGLVRARGNDATGHKDSQSCRQKDIAKVHVALPME